MIVALLEASRAMAVLPVAADADLDAELSRSRSDVAVIGWLHADLIEVHRMAEQHPYTAFVAVLRDTNDRVATAYRAAGAAAVLSSVAQPRMLVASVLVVSVGMRVAPRISRWHVDGLSKREAEVLNCLDTGLRLPQVARILNVNVETVRSQTKSIYRKLGVHSRAELRALLLTPDPMESPKAATSGLGACASSVLTG